MRNHSRIARFFILSAGLVLLISSVAKLVSAAGNAPILIMPDPVFGISFRNVFFFVGTIEFAIALICICSNRLGLQSVLLVWLAASCAAYRISRQWIGYNRPCPCMGNITDALHLSPQTLDSIMKYILLYIFVGSFTILVLRLRENNFLNATAPS